MSHGAEPRAQRPRTDSDIAVDVLSCVESGEQSVLDLISKTAFSLGNDGSSSATSSSNSSLNVYSDNENDNASMKLALSDVDDDISYEYPLKSSTLSSAFSNHISSNKSRLYDGYIDPRQTAQFLLPLLTSLDETPANSKFVIKHEDILRVLAENSAEFNEWKNNPGLNSIISEVLAENMNAPDSPEHLPSNNIGEITKDIKELFKNLSLERDSLRTDLKTYQEMSSLMSSFDDDKNDEPDKSVCDGENVKDSKDDSSADTNEKCDPAEQNKSDGDSKDDEVICRNFLDRDCCDNRFLANEGTCTVNNCHENWKEIPHSLLKYILTPSSTENIEMPEDEFVLHGFQTLVDCDSVNPRRRFTYDPDDSCPGACGNAQTCSTFLPFHEREKIPSPPKEPKPDDKADSHDDIYILFDIQSGWDELKLLTLWIYWAIEKEMGDLSELAIGFQVPCECCYCIAQRRQIEGVKDIINLSPKCICQKKIVAIKCKGRSKTKYKSDTLQKDAPKCPYCTSSADKEINTVSDPVHKKIVELFRAKEITSNQCCCQNARSKIVNVGKLPPMFVCSKDPKVPSMYVDILTGDEIPKSEMRSKADKAAMHYYNASKERWLKGKFDFNRVPGTGACKRCRCNCSTIRFYDFNKIASRITLIVENLARVSMPKLYHRMRGLYLALCARFNARLYILLGSNCEYTFLKELIHVTRIIRDGGIWLMTIMGPTRFRLSNTLYGNLPRKIFLQLLYLEWAGPAALHVFLKLSVMLCHNTLPANWKDVLLLYVNVLPYIHGVEANNEQIPETNDIRIDPDEHLDKMYHFYHYVKKRYNYKEKLYSLLLSKNKNSANAEHRSQQFVFSEDDVIQFYTRIVDVVDLLTHEIELLTDSSFSGWDNFEKLIVFAAFKVFATGQCIDNEFLNQQIHGVFNSFHDYLTNFKRRLYRQIPTEYLLNTINNSPTKLHILPFTKRGFVDHILRLNSSFHLKDDVVKHFARAFYFNHSKRCRNAWVKIMSQSNAQSSSTAIVKNAEIERTLSTKVANPLLENFKPKPVNIVFVHCSPEFDSKNFWTGLKNKVYQKNTWSSNEQMRNMLNALDNNVVEEVDVPETFSYNDTEEAAESVETSDSSKKSEETESGGAVNPPPSPSPVSSVRELVGKSIVPSFLESIKISPTYIEFIEFIDKKLGIPPNYKKSLIKMFEHHNNMPKEFDTIFNHLNCNDGMSDAKCSEKCFNSKECTDKDCMVHGDDDDLEYSEEHCWDPLIEEIENELKKLEKKDKSNEDYENDLNIACFNYVTCNMMHEMMHEGTLTFKKKIKSDKLKSDKLKRELSNNDDAKLIGHIFMDDHWKSDKTQFYEWRNIVKSMYAEVIQSERLKEKSKDGNTFDKFPEEKVKFGDWYVIFSKLIKLIDEFVPRPKRLGLGVPETSPYDKIFETRINEATWAEAISEVAMIDKKKIVMVNRPPINIRFGKEMAHVNEVVKKFFPQKFYLDQWNVINRILSDENGYLPLSNSSERPHIFGHIHMLDEIKASVKSMMETGKLKPEEVKEQPATDKTAAPNTDPIRFSSLSSILDKKIKPTPDAKINGKAKDAKPVRSISQKDEKILSSIEKLISRRRANKAQMEEAQAQAKAKAEAAARNDLAKSQKEGANPHEVRIQRPNTLRSDDCSNACSHEDGQKCTRHPEMNRQGHQQSGDHPCNCCYCTVFGHAANCSRAPHTIPVSRSYTETRRRLRTILNKKKMSNKPAATTPPSQNPSADVEQQDNKKNAQIQQNKPAVKPVPQQGVITKLPTSKATAPAEVKSQNQDPKWNVPPNVKPTPAQEVKSTVPSDAKNIKKQETATPKIDVKTPAKIPEAVIKKVMAERAPTPIFPSNYIKTTIENPIVKNNLFESKSIQTDTNSNSDHKRKIKNNQAPENPPPVKTGKVEQKPQNQIPAPDSRDSSFCTSSICSGCSEYKGHEEEIDMLVKFIEEPLPTVDREKKQAKKARQKNKKIKLKLLKERVELHENLMSMVGQTSRLREEVVRLEQGLASACRRLPQGEGTPNEEIESELMWQQVPHGLSERANEIAVFAEHAHSRLRHVKTALNQISTSVNKAYIRQQKLEQLYSPENPAPYSAETDNNKSDQGMVTIKRVILPYSEEPGVTITPKGSDQLIYASHDQARMMTPSLAAKNYEKQLADKQKPAKKTNLSWESTIAQINTLAQSKKIKEAQNAQAKIEKKADASKTQKDKGKTDNKPVKPSEPEKLKADTSKTNKNAKKLPEEPKVKKTQGKVDKEPEVKSNDNKNKKKPEQKIEKEPPKTGKKNKNDGSESVASIDEFLPATKKDKKNQNKNEATSAKNAKKEAVPNEKNAKNVAKNTNEKPQNKDKKAAQPAQNNQTKKQQKASQPTVPQQLNLVNSLSTTMDRIKLNDDTTIELATPPKKDGQGDDLNKNLNAPVSSSIMEQLRSGVQFADLRLPPGITLTRVDPAKQQHVSPKANIPLMTNNTPAAYRPTPPAPPPPAVIMVDTTKLHADRESNANQADAKKAGKSKKSKKKYKKGQMCAQPLPGSAGSTTLKLPSHQSEEAPKMVTLRNPMFHSALSNTGVPTLQPQAKRVGDIRLPDPIQMPSNVSCQATITPTSNGMYTIRNPLMSIVHQKSMMGMNTLDSVNSPLLLMPNQQINGSPTPSYHTMGDKSNMEDQDVNHSVADITSRLSEISLERQGDVPKSDEYKYTFKPDDKPPLNKNIARPSPINCLERTVNSPDRPPPNPIGTELMQRKLNRESLKSGSTLLMTEPKQQEPQKFYTPFGPTDANKSFGSVMYQPYVCNNAENSDVWPNHLESDVRHGDDKNLLPSIFLGLGSTAMINPNASAQRLDGSGPPLMKMNEDLKPRSAMAPGNNMYYQMNQKPFDISRETPPYSNWNSPLFMNNQDDRGYAGHSRTAVSPSVHSAPLSTPIITGPNTNYTMTSNSSSPLDLMNQKPMNYMQSEYPYNPAAAHHDSLKTHAGLGYMPMNENFGKPVKNDGFRTMNDYMDPDNPNNVQWGEMFEPDKKIMDGDARCLEDMQQPDLNNLHGIIGGQRLMNGLDKDMYFTGSGNIFAPDQSIKNLNELDSSERDIESFKRFEYYFDPPKNKPKISLNVQDIAQRASSSKSTK